MRQNKGSAFKYLSSRSEGNDTVEDEFQLKKCLHKNELKVSKMKSKYYKETEVELENIQNRPKRLQNQTGSELSYDFDMDDESPK